MKRSVNELLFAIERLQGDVVSVGKDDLKTLADEICNLRVDMNVCANNRKLLERRLEREDKINKSLMAQKILDINERL